MAACTRRHPEPGTAVRRPLAPQPRGEPPTCGRRCRRCGACRGRPGTAHATGRSGAARARPSGPPGLVVVRVVGVELFRKEPQHLRVRAWRVDAEVLVRSLALVLDNAANRLDLSQMPQVPRGGLLLGQPGEQELLDVHAPLDSSAYRSRR